MIEAGMLWFIIIIIAIRLLLLLLSVLALLLAPLPMLLPLLWVGLGRKPVDPLAKALYAPKLPFPPVKAGLTNPLCCCCGWI
jgi:hypothetical protein